MLIDKKLIVFSILVFVLSLNICYANPFSENINEENKSIVGSMFEKYNIEFEDAYVTEVKGADKENTKAQVSIDKKSLNVNVSDLNYPGAYAKFSANIVNNGNVSAKIKSVKIKGLKENSVIRVEILNDNIINKEIDSGKNFEINFKVKWDEEFNFEVNEQSGFNIQIVCE